MLNNKELLKPRYKVIADYPKSLYYVGDILNAGWRSEDLIYCDHDGPRWRDYPHLFKKLEWWEDRKKKDMPEYVKLPKSGGEVRKVIKWDLKEDCAAALTGNYWCYTPFISPATVEEYEQYLKTKQQ